jgi:hypothetical protein
MCSKWISSNWGINVVGEQIKKIGKELVWVLIIADVQLYLLAVGCLVAG